MSWAEKVWGHFYNMDVSGDGHVDSSEMLDYLTANQAQPSHSQVTGQHYIPISYHCNSPRDVQGVSLKV